MNTTSASLLERAASGADRAAWDRLVELYTPLLFQWCGRLGMSNADAADFTQDVFVKLLEHLPDFRYDSSKSFRAWLKTVLMNVWRKHLRKSKRITPTDLNPDLVPDTDPGVFVDEAEYRDHLIRRALSIAKSDFEPTTWTACWEFLVHDRPADAVAKELGISVNSVYLAKSRVLRHLRAELAGLVD